MLPLAPSGRGLPRERVEESAKQKALRLFLKSNDFLVAHSPSGGTPPAPSRREPKVTLRRTIGTPRVSLRLGRALVLTPHRVVIHYARVATLRRPLQSLSYALKFIVAKGELYSTSGNIKGREISAFCLIIRLSLRERILRLLPRLPRARLR